MAQMKEYFAKMSKKRKIVLGSVAGAILVAAIVLVFVLNGANGQYQVLYTGLDPSEASSVYQVLRQLGAEPRLDDAGDVMVPSAEFDIWLFELAARGYPRTALSYDTFANNAGMTATESQNQQWQVYQLQDRIQQTLQQIGGVELATVTITMPEDTDYVWQQVSDTQVPTAGVLLTLQPDVQLSALQIGAIKNLIASSVPEMSPEDVTVVDAMTSLELMDDLPDEQTNSITVEDNLAFELTVQQQLEDNVVRLLASRYGEDGVVAAAKVTLNYDQMITESLQLQERPVDENGEGGGGFMTGTSGAYQQAGDTPIGGIVGEEDNTDIPDYSYVTPGGDEDATYYAWDTDFDYSYIKTQIEKGNAIIERATVSVMVDEDDFDQARREELTALISNSTDIPTEMIFVSAFNPDGVVPPTVEPEPEPEPAPGGILGIISDLPLWVYIAAGVVFVGIIVLIIVLVRLRKKKKMAKQLAKERAEEEERLRQQMEIDEYKKQLTDAAIAATDPKEEAILEEVREFAKGNPEVTANLLRAWLREEDA